MEPRFYDVRCIDVLSKRYSTFKVAAKSEEDAINVFNRLSNNKFAVLGIPTESPRTKEVAEC